MTRGSLRVYLGAAPGVGKTLAMLDEGTRRQQRGADVVVAFVETHGREQTEQAIGTLEVLPRRRRSYSGTTFEEMDVDAVLSRRPQLALVDELAHTNVDGSTHAKRWQDVEALLTAGIDVISTVNIQHLESLNDLVEKITGVAQRETVPDRVVRAAEQIHLVDQTPEALRRRMAHGNIYAADQVDAALNNYFRIGNLTALRELALLWVADRVDEGLQRYREEHEIDSTWEARERVVVALTGGPEGSTLIRRASRIAARGGAELLAVHIAGTDGLTTADSAALAEQRNLVESLDGSYHVVRGNDVSTALLEFARGVNATQLVLGASRRGPVGRLTGFGIGVRTVRRSGDIDVHIVTHEAIRKGRERRKTAPTSWRHSLRGAILAAILLPALTLILTSLRHDFNSVSTVLVYLLATVAVALVGGLVVAALTAIAASLVLNFFFIEPLHHFTIARRDNVLGLVVFVVVAAVVAVLVDRAERRRHDAAEAAAEAETLAALAGSVLRGRSQLPVLLEQLREIFSVGSVSLLEQIDGSWTVVAAAGPDAPTQPELADTIARADGVVLALRGPVLAASEQRVLAAFAFHAAAALQTQRLAHEAQAVAPLREADRTRTALLQAVSHDLRTPLASAKAAVSSLRGGRDRIQWSEEDRSELLATADESLDRLARLVDNLLDMSRLQAGALAISTQTVHVEDVVARALDNIGPNGDSVSLSLPLDLPPITADAGLLERIIGNLLENALRYAPVDRAPAITASTRAGWVEIRVVDRGPGLARGVREQVFEPFQRLGDTSNTIGVGLGLALARGFAQSMGGTLTPEETPGGGLTMSISLPVAPSPPPTATSPVPTSAIPTADLKIGRT
ncbi:MAG: Osmosensitive channel signal transduction histidine kinase [Pseudonocardiales bacterium]|nr:Osmosensitive channel signal transduction histidine kinase [Pseudonocardiales bacterium]